MRRLVIASVGAALALGSSAAGAPTWNEPVQLSQGDRALSPEITVSPRRDAAVVWDQEVGSDCAASPASLGCAHLVEFATRVHGSSTWQSPIELGRPGIGDRPRVAINDAGDALVAWVHDIGRDRVLQATFRSRGSNAWPEPSDISEASLGIQAFGIGLDDRGNAIAVWSERTETGTAVRIATRSVDSGGWGAARTLSRPGSDVPGGLSLAQTPGGAVAVVWIEDGAVQERESVIGWGSASGSWVYPHQISSPADIAIGAPDVTFDQMTGEVVAVWAFRTGSSCCFVGAAFHSFWPETWAEQTIGSVRSQTDSPRVGAGNGNAVAVWASSVGIVSAAHAQPRGANPTTWSSEVPISPRSSTVVDPQVAVDSIGNAIAVWASRSEGVIQSAIRPRASGRWEPPVDLSTAGASAPRLSGDAAFAVWNRSSPPRVAVEASDFAPKGPVLEQLIVPKAAIVAGARARFSVRSVPWASPVVGAPVWAFGDGHSAVGASVTHVYTRAGRFTATVTATDAAGGTTAGRALVAVIAERLRNRRLPWIAGQPTPGRTLTCRRGIWTGSPPIRFVYGWRRNGSFVPGATTPRYRVSRRDVGSLIACEVTARNPGGSVRAASGVVAVER